MLLRRSLKALITLFILFLLTGFALVLPASAGQRNGLVFRVGCDGFISRGGEIVFNRDNTGQGREQIVFTATDGQGNVIYSAASESFRVGARLTLPPGLFFGWTAAPVANPLWVRVYSPAGNGLDEQTLYTVPGNCGDVETIAIEEEITLSDYLDGITSPTVPLNATAPRPTNVRDLAHQPPGYLIVNTDNLNVRSGDGPEYTIVAKIDGGTQLLVLGRNRTRSWWFVQVGDVRGWVLGELTIIRGDLTGIPIVPITGEITRPTLFLFDLTPLAVLPLDGSLLVCELPGNLEYYIIGRNAKASWFELEATCNGAPVTGWVKAEEGGLRNPSETFIPITD